MIKKTYPIALLMCLLSATTLAQTRAKINPNIENQTLDGWGGSLSWWANIVGGHDEAKIDLLSDWITNPSHLNMNLFRFNIGAGDTPEHDHMRSNGGDMPSYKPTADGPYDWTQDAKQRLILQKLIESRENNIGENDMKLVAFSTSPPWWMTKSGCSSGAVTSNTTNLKDDMYDDFADYLTTVVKYYHDSLGIIFNYLEPMNEPDGGWWVAEGNQEGCYFTITDQKRLLKEVHASLDAKGMLTYCKLAGSDWNNIGNACTALKQYISDGDIMDKVDHIDTHSYFGSDANRLDIQRIAKEQKKSLWQSESGPLNIGVSANYQVMHIAQRIITDLKLMRANAWIDWQIVDEGSIQWALVDGKYSNQAINYSKNISFHIRSQYSRFIKPGYTIISSNRSNMIAAISPEKDKIAFVICNTDTNGVSEAFDIDLSLFEIGGGIPYKYITTIDGAKKVSKSFVSLTENNISYSAPAQSVTTFVIPIIATKEAPKTDVMHLSNFENGFDQFMSVELHSSFAGTFPDAAAPHNTWHIITDSIATNPNKTVNTTEKAYVIQQENSDWWGNFLNFKMANTNEGIAINDDNIYLHVFHYRTIIDNGWSLYINSEVNCSDEGNKRRIDGNNSIAAEWEDLVFDLSYLRDQEQTLDLFTFCMNTDYSNPKLHPMAYFAFDEIILNNDPNPRINSAAKLTNTLKCNDDIAYSCQDENLRIWAKDRRLLHSATLYNMQGQKIQEGTHNSTELVFQIAKAGVYICRINDGISYKTMKIIVNQ